MASNSPSVRVMFKDPEAYKTKPARGSDVKDTVKMDPVTTDAQARGATLAVCSTEHKSKGDSTNHITVRFLDKDGNHITTRHIEINEEQ